MPTTRPRCALLLLFMAALACDGGPSAPPTRAAVAQVVITSPTASLVAGQTAPLTARVFDGSGNPLTDRAVAWSSSDPAVAAVAGTQLNAVRYGTARLSATSEGVTGTLELTVRAPVPARVRITPDPVALEMLDSTTLTATALDAAGNPIEGHAVQWSIADTTRARITPEGRLTALRVGATQVRAEAGGLSATAALTVRDTLPAWQVRGALLSGDTATLVGTGLRRIRSLTVDGRAVAARVSGDTLARFALPVLRACETDGRPVELVANGTVRQTHPLRVAGTLRMTVGETRVLDPREDLSCLRLPAGQGFALSALNRESFPGGGYMRPRNVEPLHRLFTLTTHSAGTGPLLEQPQTEVRTTVERYDGPDDSRRVPAPAETADPVPFDPRYATARVGDTLRFVNWSITVNGQYVSQCHVDRNAAPHYPVVVVAVREPVVMALDLREADAAALWADRQWYQQVADIAAPLLIPAMRQVFDPDFRPLAGGGGRVYALLQTGGLAGGVAVSDDGGTGTYQSVCPLASEMTTVVMSTTRVNRTPFMAANVAADLVHEYAHNADWIVADRVTGEDFRSAGWWMNEAWPQMASEAARRIARARGLRPVEMTTRATLWGAQPQNGPFSNAGYYDAGARVLTLAREQWGDIDVEPDSRAPRLFQALLTQQVPPTTETSLDLSGDAVLQNRHWSLHALAALLGTDARTLLERWVLADATDDLVDNQAADAAGLPRYRVDEGMTMRRRDQLFGHDRYNRVRLLPETQPVRRTLAAAPASYAAAYWLPDGGAGVSLTLHEFSDTPVLVRLTRLR